MAAKVMEVEVGGQVYRVHAPKARDAMRLFNAIPACLALVEKIQGVLKPANGSGPVHFADEDFDVPGALIASLTGMTDEQVGDLELMDWFGLLMAAVQMAGNFTAPAATPASTSPKSWPSSNTSPDEATPSPSAPAA